MKTYKDIVKKDFPRLTKLNSQLRNNVKELQDLLADQNLMDPVKYRAMEEKLKTFDVALKTIHVVCNPVTVAWDIADSVLRKYE